MLSADKFIAILPCLNEARAIGSLTRKVREHVSMVLVIDDGSSDTTSEDARQAGAEVLRHDHPMGKGAALRDGCRWALDHGYEWAFCLDGDGQHDPDDIPGFIQCIENKDVQMVVGNRMGTAKGMPWLRRCTNRYMSWRLSRLAGKSMPDTQCGYRLVHLPSWDSLDIRADHFEADSEWLIAFARAGLEIAFVPIRVIYGEETSKIHPLRDTLRWLRWLRQWRR